MHSSPRQLSRLTPAAAPRRAVGHVVEPSRPGLSATYTGTGAPWRRYFIGAALLSTCYAVLWTGAGMLLVPFHVQQLLAPAFFTGADAGVDLAALADLKAAVAAGAVVATAEQQRLLGLLAGYEAARAQGLSWVTSLSALAVMVVGPLLGSWGDRTRTRWGRRTPWIIGGALLGAVFLIGLRHATTIAVIAALWTLARTAYSASGGAVSTTIVDRVPSSKRGVASSLNGLGGYVGGIVGVAGLGLALATVGLDLYYVLAVVVFAAAWLFVVLAPDRSSLDLAPPPAPTGSRFAGFWSALADHDFRWVWLGRAAMILGQTASSTFALYMLQGYIVPALSVADAARITPLMGAAALPGTMVAMLLAGRISDRLGRRKPIVLIAALAFASSLAIPFAFPTLWAMFAHSILSGISFGSWMTVQGALTMDVLPDPEFAGRDLGVAAVAQGVGNAVAPLVAAQVVALTGGYRMVWAFALVSVLVSVLCLLPVKRVR